MAPKASDPPSEKTGLKSRMPKHKKEARARKKEEEEAEAKRKEDEEDERLEKECEKWIQRGLTFWMMGWPLLQFLFKVWDWATRSPLVVAPAELAGQTAVVTGGCDGVGLDTLDENGSLGPGAKRWTPSACHSSVHDSPPRFGGDAATMTSSCKVARGTTETKMKQQAST